MLLDYAWSLNVWWPRMLQSVSSDGRASPKPAPSGSVCPGWIQQQVAVLTLKTFGVKLTCLTHTCFCSWSLHLLITRLSTQCSVEASLFLKLFLSNRSMDSFPEASPAAHGRSPAIRNCVCSIWPGQNPDRGSSWKDQRRWCWEIRVQTVTWDGAKGTFLVVQWLRLHAPNPGGPGSIPGQGTSSHMPQLKIPHAVMKTVGPSVHN